MKAKLLGMAAALAGLAAAPQAQATIVNVIYTGTVASGTDVTGVFGLAGANIVGDSFAAKYLFNTALGLDRGTSGPGFVSYETVGGLVYDAPSPVLSAGLTINGVTANIGAPDWLGVIASRESYMPNVVGQQQHEAESGMPNTTNYSYLGFVLFGYGLNGSQTGPFTVNLTKIDFTVFDAAFRIETGASAYAYGTLNPTELSVYSSVPELSTWAMMLAGFASLGFVGSSRSVKRS